MKGSVVKYVTAAVLIAVGNLAHADFSKGMTPEKIHAEVQAQKQSGKTAEEIAKAAIAMGVNAQVLVTAMLSAGMDPPP